MRILVLPKWYPWPDRPVFGLFCREHARAAALHHDVRVLAFTPAQMHGLYRIWEDEEELGGDCYFISELRSTEEWKVLQKTILEAGEIDLESTDEENVVICWNDSEKTTAEDAATMFRKAALVADEQVS